MNSMNNKRMRTRARVFRFPIVTLIADTHCDDNSLLRWSPSYSLLFHSIVQREGQTEAAGQRGGGGGGGRGRGTGEGSY
jgi:hypothetical protein